MFSKNTFGFFLSTFLVFGITNYSNAAITAMPDPDTWITDGGVLDIENSNGVNYIGGTFNHVGKVTGSGVIVDSVTGTLLSNFPFVNNTINSVVADGNGGWYIGGEFTKVGAYDRATLAHILADGSVDPNWNPGTNGRVQTLYRNGNQLFVGGSFNMVDGQSRTNAAEFDLTTGQLKNLNLEFNGPINCFLLQGTNLYVGGKFTKVGIFNFNGIVQINLLNGGPTNFEPALTIDPTMGVSAMALNGTTLYVGGRHLEAVDTTTKLKLPWDSQFSNTGQVNALEIFDGSLFVAGNFQSAGGVPRFGFASYDLASGNITTLDARVNGAPKAMAISNPTVYLGGDFDFLSFASRPNAGSVNLTIADEGPWNPITNRSVNAIAVQGNQVYLGGSFSSVNMTPKKNLAAFSETSGTMILNFPDYQYSIFNLEIAGDKLLTMGTARIAAFDLPSGGNKIWEQPCNTYCWTAKVDGSTIYVGGTISNLAGQARQNLAALNLEDGTLLDWAPTTNNAVYAMDIDGETIYIGGQFQNVNGQLSPKAAALDKASGTLLPWEAHPDTNVKDMRIHNGLLYLAGNFSLIGTQSRPLLAAVDPLTGNPTSWAPKINGSIVESIDFKDNSVYAGGAFTTQGISTLNMSSFDLNTGDVTETVQHYPHPVIYRVKFINGNFYLTGQIAQYFQDGKGGNWGSPLKFSGDNSGGNVGSPAVGVASISPNSGPATGGTIVTIQGSGFQSGIEVYFGSSRSNNVNRISETQLTAQVPPGNGGLTDVRVVNPDATSVTVVNGFNYTAPPAKITIPPSQNSINTSKGETAIIQYGIDTAGHVEITLYDRLGRETIKLLDAEKPAGVDSAQWDGKDSGGTTVAPGVYHAVIKEAGNTRKLKILVVN